MCGRDQAFKLFTSSAGDSHVQLVSESSDVKGEAVWEDMIQDCYRNDLEKKAVLFLIECSAAFKVLTHTFSAVNLLCFCTGRGDCFYFNSTEKISSSQPLLTIPCSLSELASFKQHFLFQPSVYVLPVGDSEKETLHFLLS